RSPGEPKKGFMHFGAWPRTGTAGLSRSDRQVRCSASLRWHVPLQLQPQFRRLKHGGNTPPATTRQPIASERSMQPKKPLVGVVAAAALALAGIGAWYYATRNPNALWQ